MKTVFQTEQEKLFTKQTMLLVPFGILINYIGVKIALYFHLPIFLDSIGTLFAAALGGSLPGIIVGFFSNAINSVGDPITLYYGIISILLAICASVLSRRYRFTSLRRALLSALVFTLIGGVLGSMLTWALSGLDIGSGISSGYANNLYNQLWISKFFAQLIADVAVDLLDKVITVICLFLLLKAVPSRWLERMPLGGVYLKKHGAPPCAGKESQGENKA